MVISKKVISLDKEIKKCIFLRRVNRFVVECKHNDERFFAHINNTGRLIDLLVPGRGGLCYRINGEKLKYRLIALQDVNGYAVIDTYLHEKSFENSSTGGYLEYLGECEVKKKNPRINERTYDYILKCSGSEYLVEVKSATTRVNGYASYPDAPTLRGMMHIENLPFDSQTLGAKPLLVFVAGLRDVIGFSPNSLIEPRIKSTLRKSIQNGLIIKAISIYIDEQDLFSIYLGSSDLPIFIGE